MRVVARHLRDKYCLAACVDLRHLDARAKEHINMVKNRSWVLEVLKDSGEGVYHYTPASRHYTLITLTIFHSEKYQGFGVPESS